MILARLCLWTIMISCITWTDVNRSCKLPGSRARRRYKCPHKHWIGSKSAIQFSHQVTSGPQQEPDFSVMTLQRAIWMLKWVPQGLNLIKSSTPSNHLPNIVAQNLVVVQLALEMELVITMSTILILISLIKWVEWTKLWKTVKKGMLCFNKNKKIDDLK